MTTLPTGGTLEARRHGRIALNGTFTQADVNAGRVSYVQGGGDGNDSFAFSVSDDAGAAATGTFSITVTDPKVVQRKSGRHRAELRPRNATATLTQAPSWATATTGGGRERPWKRRVRYRSTR